ncbi:DUF6009 family protein [Streptomyces sp. NPDC059378]|uniref:DUF6009 family protein n=1 Tax=Streptomyces sp. NPDC059378 TaxID=3346815 RepID=UPI0036AA212E
MFAALVRADRRVKGGLYLRGLLLDGRRKSMQPMAGRLGVGHQQLQQFMTSSAWPVDTVRGLSARRAVAVVRPQVWVVDEISHESEFVWLEDIEQLDCVRQSLERLPTRKGKPAYCRDGRMVGYAVLGPAAKPSRACGTLRRRVLWLLPHDRDSRPDGDDAKGAPAEAVDPRTLEPRVKGCKTERSQGGPPSTALQEPGTTRPL